MKAIFVRLDKIGDLIATLPVDQSLPKDVHVKWVVAQGMEFVKYASPARHTFEVPLQNPRRAFKELLQFLRSEKPDLCVIFYAPWWASLAAFMAGVPLRIGRRSQWHSYLFLNAGLRQSRSRSERHEYEYNEDLMYFAMENAAEKNYVSHHDFNQIKIPSENFLKLEPPLMRQLFEKHDIRPQEYVVVHPGMAGSALNWPQANYSILIEKLVNATTVVITGTEADEHWLNELRPQWEKHPRVRWLQSKFNLAELLFVLKNARAVVAPSTGVLHLAVACGTPSVGLYSPVLAHHSRRWGPRGPNAVVLEPGEAHSIYGNEDPRRMEEIKVNDVIKNLPL